MATNIRNVSVNFGEDNLKSKHQPKGNKICFDGIYYKGNFIKSGNKCRFLWSKDKGYGYKIFTNDYCKRNMSENIPPTEEQARLVFTIQKLLFEGGFSPEPYEIIKCHDDTTGREYFAIKMETIKGNYAKPRRRRRDDPEAQWELWVKRLNKFCKANEIGTDRKPDALDVYSNSNCIVSKKNNKIYLVDVDIRFKFMGEGEANYHVAIERKLIFPQTRRSAEAQDERAENDAQPKQSAKDKKQRRRVNSPIPKKVKKLSPSHKQKRPAKKVNGSKPRPKKTARYRTANGGKIKV